MAGSLQKVAHQLVDPRPVRLEREMAGVQQVQLGIGQVAPEGARTRHGEERIVASPDDQRGRARSNS